MSKLFEKYDNSQKKLIGKSNHATVYAVKERETQKEYAMKLSVTSDEEIHKGNIEEIKLLE